MAEISDEEYLAQHPEHRELDPAIRQRLRITAQLEADLVAERTAREQLQRAATFREAGLADLPVRELFEKTYEGEMTVEAIRVEAEKYGLLQTSAAVTAPAPADNRAELEALRRTQQASAGAPPNSAMDFGDALDRARSVEEWEAIMVQAPPEAGVRLRGTVAGSRLI
jgi:hypothetical protein